MAQFPQTESEIASLAMLVAQGLQQALDDFPAPPTTGQDLQAKWERYNSLLAATVVAENMFREEHAAKDDALQDMVKSLKADLKYAEAAAYGEPAKLSRLGWGPRRDSATLQPPGEVRDIKIVSEGDTWVILRWNPPVDGGTVSAYKIQRQRDNGPWEEAAISTNTQELMSNQPRGVELHFRVIAVNKAGAGSPSATAKVVL